MSNARDDLVKQVHRLRSCYDALPPAGRATLRRCATAGEVLLEGTYWRLVAEAGLPEPQRARMAHVVACFDAAKQADGGEPFGRWLRHTVFEKTKDADLPARAVRVRRLLAARDRDELVHQLRRLVRHGFQSTRRGVNWGALGADILLWGDGVRRRWAQDFFAPTHSTQPAVAAAEETSHA